MPKEIACCPMKFTSKTLSEDGFIRKNTCECDEARCAWWNSETNSCAVVVLARSFDSVQKLDKVKLKLMLASSGDKEAIESMKSAAPYMEVTQELKKALE